MPLAGSTNAPVEWTIPSSIGSTETTSVPAGAETRRTRTGSSGSTTSRISTPVSARITVVRRTDTSPSQPWLHVA